MFRSLTSLIVALAVLVPGLAWPSPTAPAAGMAAHACCLRAKMQGCAATAITCCPAPDRGHQGATPPASGAAASAPQQVVHASVAAEAPEASLARAIAFNAHAQDRANAPPGPLYLKHLTLLV